MPGGAAYLNGRLQVGDEITHINGYSVINASHFEVISVTRDAASRGEVILSIHRRIPIFESTPPSSYTNRQDDTRVTELDGCMPPKGTRHITVYRPDVLISFGFVLQLDNLFPGCFLRKYITVFIIFDNGCVVHVGRLVPGSPIEKCNQLYVYDELLAVNGKNICSMSIVFIINLIKISGTYIRLVVQQPANIDLIRQRMVSV